MIKKSYNLKTDIFKECRFILFYGKNEGFKNQEIDKILKNSESVIITEENEILTNKDIFLESLLSGSLFEETKTYVIKRSTDKIINIIEELDKKEVKVNILINSGQLEKKSKLRNYFEKSKKDFCIAFYQDDEKSLSKLAHDFLRDKNISISNSNINLVVNKCNGDRENLFNELKKIESFALNGKKPTFEDISKLTNLAENFGISELADNYLAKNKKKIIKILNENNFTNDECVQITRTFLNKSKKILLLSKIYENNKNLDLTISSAKPPIFWKDKEITKQQILYWPSKKILGLIHKIVNLELLVKKNINNSIYLIKDFILDQS